MILQNSSSEGQIKSEREEWGVHKAHLKSGWCNEKERERWPRACAGIFYSNVLCF